MAKNIYNLPLAQYKRERMARISKRQRAIIGLDDPSVVMFLESLWTKQYYEYKLQELEKKQ